MGQITLNYLSPVVTLHNAIKKKQCEGTFGCKEAKNFFNHGEKGAVLGEYS